MPLTEVPIAMTLFPQHVATKHVALVLILWGPTNHSRRLPPHQAEILDRFLDGFLDDFLDHFLDSSWF
jgi:hypothetical protein